MKKTGKAVLVSLIMLGFVILPGLSQAVDREAKFHEYRHKMVQQLNLPPDKAKEFSEVGDKDMQGAHGPVRPTEAGHGQSQTGPGRQG